jgi:hypothetical protein
LIQSGSESLPVARATAPSWLTGKSSSSLELLIPSFLLGPSSARALVCLSVCPSVRLCVCRASPAGFKNASHPPPRRPTPGGPRTTIRSNQSGQINHKIAQKKKKCGCADHRCVSRCGTGHKAVTMPGVAPAESGGNARNAPGILVLAQCCAGHTAPWSNCCLSMNTLYLKPLSCVQRTRIHSTLSHQSVLDTARTLRAAQGIHVCPGKRECTTSCCVPC